MVWSFTYVSNRFYNRILFTENYNIVEQKPIVFCLDTLGFLHSIEYVRALSTGETLLKKKDQSPTNKRQKGLSYDNPFLTLTSFIHLTDQRTFFVVLLNNFSYACSNF